MKFVKCINTNHPSAKLTLGKIYKTLDSEDCINKSYLIIDDDNTTVVLPFSFFRYVGLILNLGDKFKTLGSYPNVNSENTYEVIGIKDDVWIYFIDDVGSENCLSNANLYVVSDSVDKSVKESEQYADSNTGLRLKELKSEIVSNVKVPSQFEVNIDKFKSKINYDVDLTELSLEIKKLMSDIEDTEETLRLLKLKLQAIKDAGKVRNVIHVGNAFIHRETGDKFIMLKIENRYLLHNLTEPGYVCWHKSCNTIEEAIATFCETDLPFDLFFRRVKLDFIEL